MVDSISDILKEFDFNELHRIFLDSNYYEIVFPFLLSYALFYTALSYVKIFKSKKTGEPIKPIIVLISLVVSFFGISFETSSGYSVGDFMMMIFPSISSLTIGLVGLYIVGAMMGKNFFKTLFRKDHGAYAYMAVGVIGLGTVIYYLGIVLFDWNFAPGDFEARWNVIIAVAILIMGIVFLFIDLVPIGILFLFVFFGYVYNSGQDSILDHFIDPIVFIIVIFIVLLSWVTSDKEKKTKLEKKIEDGRASLEDYEKAGVKKSIIKDIIEQGVEDNQKKFDKLYK